MPLPVRRSPWAQLHPQKTGTADQAAREKRTHRRTCDAQICRDGGCDEAHRLNIVSIHEGDGAADDGDEDLKSTESVFIQKLPDIKDSGLSHNDGSLWFRKTEGQVV